jgi:hypothetical protein
VANEVEAGGTHDEIPVDALVDNKKSTTIARARSDRQAALCRNGSVPSRVEKQNGAFSTVKT